MDIPQSTARPGGAERVARGAVLVFLLLASVTLAFGLGYGVSDLRKDDSGSSSGGSARSNAGAPDDAVGAVENPKESLVAGKIAYSGVPIESEKICQIEGWNYHIPKSSKKAELAWLFVQWAMATQVQKEQMARGGESAIKAVYEDKEVLAKPYVPTAVYLKTGGKTVLGVREKGAANGWGVPRTFLEAKNPKTGDTSVSLVPKPTFPEQEELMQTILLAISKTLSDETTAQKALDEAAASFATILKDKIK